MNDFYETSHLNLVNPLKHN